ncbi:NADP-dependent oxidoreductase domain-containing protein [Hyaloscypha finlandica]|nr:NADP-dependent oxidoreductase domain-containing protein [Hyaloscypha finlandica]
MAIHLKLNTGPTIPALGSTIDGSRSYRKSSDRAAKRPGNGLRPLILIHWPLAFKPGDNLYPNDKDGKNDVSTISYVHTWNAMEKLVVTGKLKEVGVSNFSKSEVETLLRDGSIQHSPSGNQNEIFDSGNNMAKLMNGPALVGIGKKHNKTDAQVALAWGISQGHSVLPKSKTPSRIQANPAVDFKSNAEDMKKIEKIDQKLRFNRSE